MKSFFATVFIFLIVSSAAVFFWISPKGKSTKLSQAESRAHQDSILHELWPAPKFAFRDHQGREITQETLIGRPWVANFIFTTCRSVCPLLTTKMVRLQRELADANMAFVSFSVDPQQDTQEALAEYASKWNAEETRWHLLRTDDAGVKAFAQGFRITAEKSDGGLDAVFHSQVFVLVDAKGTVRGIFDVQDPRDFQNLIQAARQLSNSPAPVARPERDGAQLYAELSCANCHENAALAPGLGGLIGQQRPLENALTVTADAAYVRESILYPDLKRVRGYPLRMPSYAGELSSTELERLVAHVSAIQTPARVEQDVGVATDPICHMDVRKTRDAISRNGQFFCSQACLDTYLAKQHQQADQKTAPKHH